LIDALAQFVDRLRMLGVGVSTSETIDAVAALKVVDWSRREDFRQALASTLIKNSSHRSLFDSLFDIWFPAGAGGGWEEPTEEAPAGQAEFLDALFRGDWDRLDLMADSAVRQFAGMERGRPVGGRYYMWKIEEGLRLEELRTALEEMLAGDAGGAGSNSGEAVSGLSARLASDEAKARIAELRRRIEEKIRSKLIEDRGPEAMARALLRPLPEEADFLQASSEDLAEMKRTVAVFSRRLATRLSYRHHHTRRGRPDFRRTIRRSLETGGVPIAPRFRHRVHRPELVVLCDVSGSVAAFSRFALMLLYALKEHFRKVRSFAFVDGVDEVTSFFENAELEEAIRRIRTEAKVVWLDGHSDYGHCLKEFVLRYKDALTPRTTVLILGDLRSNFRAPEAWALDEIRERSRRVHILNPEPQRHWDTGDSIVRHYAGLADSVHECRNLRQLSQFIEGL